MIPRKCPRKAHFNTHCPPPACPPGFSDLPPALWSIGRCLEISNYKNSIVPRFPIAIWRVLDQEENTYRWEQQLITFILLKMPHPCVCFYFCSDLSRNFELTDWTVWIYEFRIFFSKMNDESTPKLFIKNDFLNVQNHSFGRTIFFESKK